jgi:hypothetical protein
VRQAVVRHREGATDVDGRDEVELRHRGLSDVLPPRVRSHCRLRNSGAESLSESGMRWMSGLVQSNNDRALLPPQRAGVVDQDIDAPKGRGHSVDAGLFTGAVTSLFTFP